jgi:thiol-disulfide isomerase/thioredoxin
MSTRIGRFGAHGGAAAEEELPVEGSLPSFDGATGWLNSDPLSPGGLRGHVVAVQFWTYTCINWLRTLAHIRAWSRRYGDSGLVVIGVHTPEFAFEHDIDNVRRAVEAMDIDYPVAVDSDYGVWQAFANHYWPALYLVDAKGRIRHHRFGEGDFERSEMVIRQLQHEAGVQSIPVGLTAVEPRGAEVEADWTDLGSAENYTGRDRTSGFEAPAPDHLRLNHWTLAGKWTVRDDAVRANEAGARLAYQFHARDLNVVMGLAERGAEARFSVLIDGQNAGAAHGADLDEQGSGKVSEQRMYQLIRQPKPIEDRRFEIEFLDPRVEVFCFTFG